MGMGRDEEWECEEEAVYRALTPSEQRAVSHFHYDDHEWFALSIDHTIWRNWWCDRNMVHLGQT